MSTGWEPIVDAFEKELNNVTVEWFRSYDHYYDLRFEVKDKITSKQYIFTVPDAHLRPYEVSGFLENRLLEAKKEIYQARGKKYSEKYTYDAYSTYRFKPDDNDTYQVGNKQMMYSYSKTSVKEEKPKEVKYDKIKKYGIF